jgi:hypothetical protein
MNSLSLSEAGVLGFFELDETGVVRYSSSSSISPYDGSSIIGQNFFEQAAFRNREELQRLFRRFVESREAADAFSFDCFYDDSVSHTKVTLTRAFETDAFPPERIVMVSIRETGR